MSLDHTAIPERAALREGVLTCGRRLGWSTRTAIVFTERLTRRPWKRCTGPELASVLDELRAVARARAVALALAALGAEPPLGRYGGHRAPYK
jgi:hypothetical protein